jgi:hypothetical protein
MKVRPAEGWPVQMGVGLSGSTAAWGALSLALYDNHPYFGCGHVRPLLVSRAR